MFIRNSIYQRFTKFLKKCAARRFLTLIRLGFKPLPLSYQYQYNLIQLLINLFREYVESKKMPASSLHKKSSFQLRITSVIVTKSAENCRFWSHLLRNSLMENVIFCAVRLLYDGILVSL